MLCHNSTHDLAGHSSSEKTSVSRDKWNYAMEDDSKGMIVIGY